MSIKLIMENWNKFLNEEESKDAKKGKYDDNDGKDEKCDHVDCGDDDADPIEESEEGAFAPNHYCVHHGGVHHEGKIIEAEAIQHNYNFKLGRVTHYDMKLPDGTVLENIAAEEILTTKASLAEGHPGKREKGHKKLKEICTNCEKSPCEC